MWEDESVCTSNRKKTIRRILGFPDEDTLTRHEHALPQHIINLSGKNWHIYPWVGFFRDAYIPRFSVAL